VVTPRRGDICWVDLAEPRGSAPGYRRPVVVVSSDRFNRSRIRTAVVAVLTTSARAASAPGNVPVKAGRSGLDRDCTVNVTALLTLDKDDLEEPVAHLDAQTVSQVADGLRLALAL
jgi:mRNA interferase MazF